MASGIFAVLDDIASLMDDVAVATKVAARKTAGILGDDLAVNAEKATGYVSSRELPVLWAITKGSLLNKLIIIPVCLLLNAVFPIAIKLILVLGGFYLAYEGVEKIMSFLFNPSVKHDRPEADNELKNGNDERIKIKSAVTTDFILSVEIVIIALGSVADKGLAVQIMTVSAIALLATIGVYGIVALIVRMDDFGYKLIKNSMKKGIISGLGTILVKALPVIIRILSVSGTVALLLVSGGIFTHNITYLHHITENIIPVLKDLIVGLIAGLIVIVTLKICRKVYSYLT